MAEITLNSFTETLDVLIDANPHARNKGDEFKAWSKDNFGCDARISYIKEQRQITNRVSEQFRYFAPIVIFVCVPEVKRDVLVKYILERVYKQLENVAIIGAQVSAAGKVNYKFEQLIVFKRTAFTEWAEAFFEQTGDARSVITQYDLPGSLLDGLGIDYAWYVGTTGNDENGQWRDFSDEYIDGGMWVNGWDDKFIDVVKSIAVGDRIAIKSTFTQKKNLPFDNHGKTVGAMRIKAIGTVTENAGDGKTIKVDWTRLDPFKTWFGPGVLREAIHRVDASDGYIKKQLLAFTFGDEEQDYSLCEEKYSDDIDQTAGVDEMPDDAVEDDMDVATSTGDSETAKKKTCLEVVRTPRVNLIHPLNFIIYGAPGTGKTYSTAEYALAIIENRAVDTRRKSYEERKAVMATYNDYVRKGQIVFTTFHQSYGYEEFIQGLRPDTKSGKMAFITVDGVFKRIADDALDNHEKNYVIIIDEINRANISKVFGELITLIESDKRWGEVNETCATLQSGDIFAVPNNLYIVGTMNSADKSISLIDAALRRRFEFIEQYPNASLVDDPTLRNVLSKINTILADSLESSDLLIGHSYFMGKTVDDLCAILNNSIIPLLYEYYYDNKKKVIGVLTDALKDLGIKIVDDKISRVRVEKADVQE
ncbi:MAG TPA: AAA family ATPase [Firmicutes bacterium]|nr:AAA family ATPase [Bacillota bacterium]